MYHAADHTMSNVMTNVGLWEEEFARLDKARRKKGIGGTEWTAMQNRANADDVPFLKALDRAIRSAPG